ncbi:alpha/beta hydrolase [Kaistia terrae]|uniref:Alpha/beta hydrolase n=1 Tax=Kaistia terrae TaxID=537017 RepID=A0ABW0PZR2_9HYPH|nr:alpha/beta hydrolase family protein [Kaistia terrae]MCX5579079.1 alpha/beta hydrolase family protein [Kaistia terrae]
MADNAEAASRVEFHQSAPSPVLGRPIPYALYTPDATPAAGERWPVVYLLHGLTGRDGDWFSWGNLATILDRMIASGAIQPLVVVAPGAGDSWYVDNPDEGSLGPMETALTSDLIAAIDARVPTAACREGRAIGGLSMGGYGALFLSLRHPDRFKAAISLSGAIAEPMRPGDPRLHASFVRDLYKGAYGEPINRDRFNSLNLFTIVAATPAPSDPPGLWMAIGGQDYPELIRAGAHLAEVLQAQGYPVEQHGGAGRHFWDYWQRAIEPALIWLSPQLKTRCD